MAPNGFMMDTRRLTKTALDVHGRLQVRLQQENDTWLGYIEDPRLGDKDDIGALYYVIAVIFIYGLSIVMMIASHIRKNKQDCQLRAYLKEMAKLRKAERRDKLVERITALAATTKVKNVFKNDASNKPGLFRISSKSSLKLGVAKRLSEKELDETERAALREDSVGEALAGGNESDRGRGGRGRAGESLSAPPTLVGAVAEEGDVTRQFLPMNRERSPGDDLSSRQDDGDETCDSEYLDLPVDFALDMNRLSPSGNPSPLTSASATPSPPSRHAKPMTKISFVDEGYEL